MNRRCRPGCASGGCFVEVNLWRPLVRIGPEQSHGRRTRSSDTGPVKISAVSLSDYATKAEASRDPIPTSRAGVKDGILCCREVEEVVVERYRSRRKHSARVASRLSVVGVPVNWQSRTTKCCFVSLAVARESVRRRQTISSYIVGAGRSQWVGRIRYDSSVGMRKREYDSRHQDRSGNRKLKSDQTTLDWRLNRHFALQ